MSTLAPPAPPAPPAEETATAPPPAPAKASSRPDPRFNGRDFFASLGDVPLERVLFHPPPGTVPLLLHEAIDGRVDGVLVELVNRTLVEKPMGMKESRIGGNFHTFLNVYVRQHNLGFVAMADGIVKMPGGNRRMPDVAVFLKTDYPDGVRPEENATSLPPRLVVEIISEGNTEAEMAMKLVEYFASGCRLAYLVYPETKTARRYTSPADVTEIAADGTLDGGDVLPGFTVELASIFEE